ncbi:acyl-protein synthetase [Pseudovirgaria hyperparasitica]|uniref:Acyl-protein synthetase n=1 Tax=Pseudovirgaria hyperparasitica TaxID=470096 RepID=A0A6A6W4E8_9PEZI|nr:acyl-protein synthetase [Pseudovirgaria hyperparasitica]KAF2757493.1 acyl-protein synthetase [Pseudovirgaria hyperparasitica]
MQVLHEYKQSATCLQDILRSRAITRKGDIVCYPLGDTSKPKSFTYSDLFVQASSYGRILRATPAFRRNHPVLIHLDDHWVTIVWFWAVSLAQGLPVLSSPFSNIKEHRNQHISGLSSLLQSPICITRERLLDLFDGSRGLLQLHTIESLCYDDLSADSSASSQASDGSASSADEPMAHFQYPGGDALAMLMLTSGSTGNAKAVRITHKQVLSAIAGKASVRPLEGKGSFLNWIGLDHVASLVEIHIQALWLGADQIHVNAADVVSSPIHFLDLLSKHRVCRTFAPNFFLAKLTSTVTLEMERQTFRGGWDLSSLQILASGGEANDIRTCSAASKLLSRYGARDDVITPGFGMTETCAGAIFNSRCPRYDEQQGRTVASLGKCVKGIEMRVVAGSTPAATNETGDLEVRGDIVFKGYYRNPKATADAFPSQDGWFRTGDRAYIDNLGNLCLNGRSKEVININGLKIVIADIDAILEQALSSKVQRYVVFPSRAAHTEQITIAYIPRESPHTAAQMAAIDELAAEVCMSSVSALPSVFSLMGSSLSSLPMTTLGKISRAKMSSLFDSGRFDEDIVEHRQRLDAFRKKTRRTGSSDAARTGTELLLMESFANTLDISLDNIGPETRLFELGFTSMDLIRLKRHLDRSLQISVPVITLLRNPTARQLAAALSTNMASVTSSVEQSKTISTSYDPVVTLKSSGNKAPLWLVHPGVGEVLVFVGLAQHMIDDDRPIYALRAKGFEGGERFSSIEATVDTYVQAIRQRQPHGPYAIAGYSYGTMLAFEITKRLERLDHGTVSFLGSFNLPPHIKSRMRQLSWNMCLLHLAQFLGLVTDTVAEVMEQSSTYPGAHRDDALGTVMHATDAARLEELGLDHLALTRWADVAYGLQGMAVDYEPSGQVASIDVFHAIPLRHAAASREEWVHEHLSKWRDFSRDVPRLHAVGGAHYTMLGADHVAQFAATLKEALHARNV